MSDFTHDLKLISIDISRVKYVSVHSWMLLSHSGMQVAVVLVRCRRLGSGAVAHSHQMGFIYLFCCVYPHTEGA
ncbi:hypothetical protein, partial [Pseudovibrio sp. POLY-S9]|uniref:hypothetical protein n=1 Tax=Pseudovibrio sp. POLY-S9 TaxID=1576596 RepID=UPI001AD90D19